MTIDAWIPSLTTASFFTVGLWFSRNLFLVRLKQSVAHEFNGKLEALRAEFREKELALNARLNQREAELGT